MLMSRPNPAGEGPALRLPDFLIVGAAKAGTTSLFRYLGQHPRMHVPPVKEPHFLSLPSHPALVGEGRYGIGPYVRELSEYARLFAGAGPDQITGDASVTYLPLWRTVIDVVGSLYAEPRRLAIVIVLRDPVARAYSHYAMKVRDGVETLDFAAATDPELIRERLAGGYDLTWDYLGLGRYADAVAAYQRAFPRTLVLDYAAFAADPAAATARVAAHLGLDDGFRFDTSRQHNRSGIPDGPLRRALAGVLFGDGPLKRAGARLLPAALKSAVRQQAEARLLTRGQADPDTAQRLRAFYQDDQRALAALLHGDAVAPVRSGSAA